MSSSSDKKIRHIVVGGKPFVWKYRSGRYRDTFRAYTVSHSSSPLHIYFNASSGRPGSVFAPDPPEAAGINLYTPAWAATLIRYALTRGWQPDNPGPPFIIEDGAGVLAALNYQTTSD